MQPRGEADTMPQSGAPKALATGRERSSLVPRATQTEKRPRGRQPTGAVLVDGKWQPTELSTQVAAERLLQYREHCRMRHRETRELLCKARPELFTRGNPKQTKLTEVCSNERNGDLRQYRRRDNSNIGASDSSKAIASAIGTSLLWNPQQRNGIPSVWRGPAIPLRSAP